MSNNDVVAGTGPLVLWYFGPLVHPGPGPLVSSSTFPLNFHDCTKMQSEPELTRTKGYATFTNKFHIYVEHRMQSTRAKGKYPAKYKREIVGQPEFVVCAVRNANIWKRVALSAIGWVIFGHI